MFLHLPTLRHSDSFSEGLFLILLHQQPFQVGATIRARVRSVKLHTVGIAPRRGETTFAGHRVYLSGAYGANGLTVGVPSEVFAKGAELPKELNHSYLYSGGLEDPALDEWAFENLLGRMFVTQQYLTLMGTPAFCGAVKRRSHEEMMEVIRDWRKRTPRKV